MKELLKSINRLRKTDPDFFWTRAAYLLFCLFMGFYAAFLK